jgi:CHAT domain-containing protein
VSALGVLLAVAGLTTQSPAADTLRLLASHLPDSVLLAEVQARPFAVRDAVSDALRQVVKSPAAGVRQDALATAQHLAAAYAAGWHDSFLVREVERFAARSPKERAAKVWVDSVRRAGITTYGRDGPGAAIAVWRQALVRARAIHDSAGMAAILGNIGAALLVVDQRDSGVAYVDQARAVAAAVGDFRVQGNALVALAGASEDQGDLATARQRYAEARAMQERIGDTRGMAADDNNLGMLAQRVGDIGEARRQFTTALTLNRRDGRDEVAATNLVNLAGLASFEGDFAQAEQLYRDALATWRTREQWSDAAAALEGLGQLELRRGDYPAARTALREALTIYNRTGPLDDALAVQREMAGALTAMGDLQRALDELRRAEQLADSARAPPGARAGIALARADLATQLNRRSDAEQLYAQAEFLYHQAGDASGAAEAQQGRGLLLLEREKYAGAQALLEAALRSQAAVGNQRGAGLTRLLLGDASLAQGDTAAARRQFARAVNELVRLGDPVAAAAALTERAALEANADAPAVAESLYRAALGWVAGRVAPDIAWRAHMGLGLALRARGAVDSAAHHLRAAVAEIEHESRSLLLPERRSAFRADKWDVYTQLALLELARGRVGTAFEASEQLRARETLELFAGSRVDAPSDTTAELLAREQDLRHRIAELTREVEVGGTSDALRGGEVSFGPAPGSREMLARAQERYADLLLEARERDPRHAGLVAPDVATWREVARRLAPDAALIEYLVSDSGSVAFVVTRDSIAGVDLGIERRALAPLVAFARGTLQPSDPDDSLWRGPLRQLYGYLIAPVAATGLLAGKTRLVLVPHAELHYLPFAALTEPDRRDRFLVERYELTVTPSASVWLALGDRPAVRSGGVLALAPRTDALPASRDEVAAIARATGRGVQVLVDGAATKEAFRREAPTQRVVHVATYGVLNQRNPLFSFLELAPGGGHDGRLDVHEVFGLRLQAELVVLSACQTGLGAGRLGDVPAGDDWVGLTRAFLHAGAANVVASLWPVADRATAQLMERFYGAFTAGAAPARALAVAQRAALTVPTTAHPFYWAGFEVAGGSGAERSAQ